MRVNEGLEEKNTNPEVIFAVDVRPRNVKLNLSIIARRLDKRIVDRFLSRPSKRYVLDVL